jgi:hypothetical protein
MQMLIGTLLLSHCILSGSDLEKVSSNSLSYTQHGYSQCSNIELDNYFLCSVDYLPSSSLCEGDESLLRFLREVLHELPFLSSGTLSR